MMRRISLALLCLAALPCLLPDTAIADVCNSPCNIAADSEPQLWFYDNDSVKNWHIEVTAEGQHLDLIDWRQNPVFSIETWDNSSQFRLVLDRNDNVVVKGTRSQVANDLEVVGDGTVATIAASPAGKDGDSGRIAVNTSTSQLEIEVKDVSEELLYYSPVVIDLDAGDDALVIDSAGRVGVAGVDKADVESDLHVGGGELFLDPTGPEGDWKLNAGAVALWFTHRDSTTPVKFENGAPTDSLVVTSSGVGIGTDFAVDTLHVEGIARVRSGLPTFKLDDSDTVGADFELRSANLGLGQEFAVHDTKAATNPLRIVTGSLSNALVIDSSGVSLASSRAIKRNVQPASPAELLDAVAQLPIYTWAYADDVSDAAHVGPMAEDFHELFGLGSDETRISSIDTAGVALAAIQALQRELELRDSRMAELEALVREMTAECAQ